MQGWRFRAVLTSLNPAVASSPMERAAGFDFAVMCRSNGASESAALRYAARPTLGGEPPARPRWCDQISTPAENQLYPYSEHSCAHRHSRDFGKLFGDSSNHRKPGVVMSIIPLDVQRRCERRWAARFSRPTEPVAPRNQRPERESQQIAGPDKSKRKAHRVQAAGSRPLSAV